jgi:hypothetical protein
MTMRTAVAHSVAALGAAAEIDLDRTDDDRAFFTGQKANLEPLVEALVKAARAIEDHALGVGMAAQVGVVVGDAVLDRGLRAGNTQTKLALKGAGGLGAEHVFGRRVDDLIKEPLGAEPASVLRAADRLADLPAFAERDAIRDDLARRATAQEGLLEARDRAQAEAARLASAGVRSVAEAAEALARLKGALDQRFPRQRDFVSTFFYDVAQRRSRARAGAPAATSA